MSAPSDSSLVVLGRNLADYTFAVRDEYGLFQRASGRGECEMKKQIMRKAGMSFVVFITVAMASGQQARKLDVVRSLVDAERAFARMAAAKGTREAFIANLADESVLFRPRAVDGMKWMREHPDGEGVLSWEPVFADAAESGDLGYTTGPWEFRRGGPDSEPIAFGQYVTIWRKQMDGRWKVELDAGIGNPKPVGAAPLWNPESGMSKQVAIPGKMQRVESRESDLRSAGIGFARACEDRGVAQAYQQFTAGDARVLRDGHFPAIGKKAIFALMAEKNGDWSWETMRGVESRDRDIAYSFGTAILHPSRDKAEHFNFVRIWKKDSLGGWRIVLDILSSAPDS